MCSPAGPGFANHAPRRALNSVNRNVNAGLEAAPMFGLTAAPDTVMHSPIEIPPAYAGADRYPACGDPQCNADIVNDSERRSCIASVVRATMFSVAFTTWSGRPAAALAAIGR